MKQTLIKLVIGIVVGIVLMGIFSATRTSHLKKSIKEHKKEVKELNNLIKKNERAIEILLIERDNIEIPNIDSILIKIDETDYIEFDTMSNDDLRCFLLGC